MTTAPSHEYVLGTGTDELQRLALQHRLWADAAHAAWRFSRIAIGQRVLDVGSGPGFASFDLAQLVTSAGRVVGVDESSAFISSLNTQAKARDLPQLRGLVGDVHELPALLSASAESELFDLAYARWVLCFVKDPAAVIAGIAASLRPGGRCVVHDYFNYRAMTTAPRRASHDRVVAATVQSWEARGGDTDICGRLPALFEQFGMEVERIEAHQRVARGGDTMFQWVHVWWHTYTPKLVGMGLITQAQCDELLADLATIKQDHTQFVTLPTVYEIIAIKPG